MEQPKKRGRQRKKKETPESTPARRSRRRGGNESGDDDVSTPIIFDAKVSKTELKRLAIDGFHNQLTTARGSQNTSSNTSRESSVASDAMKAEATLSSSPLPPSDPVKSAGVSQKPLVKESNLAKPSLEDGRGYLPGKTLHEAVSKLTSNPVQEIVGNNTDDQSETYSEQPTVEQVEGPSSASSDSSRAKKGSSRRKSVPQRRQNKEPVRVPDEEACDDSAMPTVMGAEQSQKQNETEESGTAELSQKSSETENSGRIEQSQDTSATIEAVTTEQTLKAVKVAETDIIGDQREGDVEHSVSNDCAINVNALEQNVENSMPEKEKEEEEILTEPTESESVVASKETPSKDMAKDDKLGTSDSTPGCEASAATGEIPDKDGESEEEEEGEQEIIDLEEEELRGDDVGGDVNLGAGEWRVPPDIAVLNTGAVELKEETSNEKPPVSEDDIDENAHCSDTDGGKQEIDCVSQDVRNEVELNSESKRVEKVDSERASMVSKSEHGDLTPQPTEIERVEEETRESPMTLAEEEGADSGPGNAVEAGVTTSETDLQESALDLSQSKSKEREEEVSTGDEDALHAHAVHTKDGASVTATADKDAPQEDSSEQEEKSPERLAPETVVESVVQDISGDDTCQSPQAKKSTETEEKSEDLNSCDGEAEDEAMEIDLSATEETAAVIEAQDAASSAEKIPSSSTVELNVEHPETTPNPSESHTKQKGKEHVESSLILAEEAGLTHPEPMDTDTCIPSTDIVNNKEADKSPSMVREDPNLGHKNVILTEATTNVSESQSATVKDETESQSAAVKDENNSEAQAATQEPHSAENCFENTEHQSHESKGIHNAQNEKSAVASAEQKKASSCEAFSTSSPDKSVSREELISQVPKKKRPSRWDMTPEKRKHFEPSALCYQTKSTSSRKDGPTVEYIVSGPVNGSAIKSSVDPNGCSSTLEKQISKEQTVEVKESSLIDDSTRPLPASCDSSEKDHDAAESKPSCVEGEPNDTSTEQSKPVDLSAEPSQLAEKSEVTNTVEVVEKPEFTQDSAFQGSKEDAPMNVSVTAPGIESKVSDAHHSPEQGDGGNHSDKELSDKCNLSESVVEDTEPGVGVAAAVSDIPSVEEVSMAGADEVDGIIRIEGKEENENAESDVVHCTNHETATSSSSVSVSQSVEEEPKCDTQMDSDVHAASDTVESNPEAKESDLRAEDEVMQTPQVVDNEQKADLQNNSEDKAREEVYEEALAEEEESAAKKQEKEINVVEEEVERTPEVEAENQDDSKEIVERKDGESIETDHDDVQVEKGDELEQLGSKTNNEDSTEMVSGGCEKDSDSGSQATEPKAESVISQCSEQSDNPDSELSPLKSTTIMQTEQGEETITLVPDVAEDQHMDQEVARKDGDDCIILSDNITNGGNEKSETLHDENLDFVAVGSIIQPFDPTREDRNVEGAQVCDQLTDDSTLTNEEGSQDKVQGGSVKDQPSETGHEDDRKILGQSGELGLEVKPEMDVEMSLSVEAGPSAEPVKGQEMAASVETGMNTSDGQEKPVKCEQGEEEAKDKAQDQEVVLANLGGDSTVKQEVKSPVTEVSLYDDGDQKWRGGLSRWQLVCDTLEDWAGLALQLEAETLAMAGSRGRPNKTKALCNIIRNDFLPEMPTIMADKVRCVRQVEIVFCFSPGFIKNRESFAFISCKKE